MKKKLIVLSARKWWSVKGREEMRARGGKRAKGRG